MKKMNKQFLEKNQQRAKRLVEEMDRMEKLISHSNEPKKEAINESSLSRVWKHSEEHDIAIITAMKSKNINCFKVRDGEREGQEFTPEENKERNEDLTALLINKGYGITSVKGSYIENFETPEAVEVAEESIFVVNWNDDADFQTTIGKIGRYFCQDSVLIKPKRKDAFLLGCNNGAFPGMGKKMSLGRFKGGEEAEFMTRVGKSKRPFTFGEGLTFPNHFNAGARFVISTKAKKIISEMAQAGI